ncbi:hypothetical protein J6U76_08685 [bacterium]|nr:hypothetical protein [bacterium]
MWKCLDCGAGFIEPEIISWTENHGNGLLEPWVAQVCPFCGSDEIAKSGGRRL